MKYRILLILTALMVTFYLTANIMAVKIIHIFGISIFDAGTIVFPLTYMLGETVTELYGKHTARNMVWLTFACQILFTFFVWLATKVPYPEETEALAQAYHMVFTFAPRIMLASLCAFLLGEMTNVHIMSYIREHWGGPLWMRTIGSSILGYTLDTATFVSIAFIGVVNTEEIMTMIGIQIAAKVLIEASLSTPLTYLLCHKLKPLIL